MHRGTLRYISLQLVAVTEVDPEGLREGITGATRRVIRPDALRGVLPDLPPDPDAYPGRTGPIRSGGAE